MKLLLKLILSLLELKKYFLNLNHVCLSFNSSHEDHRTVLWKAMF